MRRLQTLLLGLVLGTAGPVFAQPAPDGVLDGVAASATAVRPLEVGARAPVATLRDVDGNPAPLDAYVGSGLVALVFYRGGW
jgi:hypothetical protein